MTDLTLKLSDENLKKLKAYIILSGSEASAIEQKLSDIVSTTLGDLLSSGIAESLVAMDGKAPASLAPVEQPEDPPVTKDDETGNELSDEDAPDEVKSLEEEVGGELPDDAAFKVDINAKDVGGDVESYIDAVVAQDKGKKPVPGRSSHNGSNRSAARKSFDPSTPRVSVGEYTGEESLDGTF
jgi:hypothetical protein